MLGITPGGGGTQRLARLLGPSRALRLLLDGEPLSPRRASELGIVDMVVAPEELLAAALEEAERMAKRPKAAIAGCKRAVYVGGSLPLEQGLLVERPEFLSTLGANWVLQVAAGTIVPVPYDHSDHDAPRSAPRTARHSLAVQVSRTPQGCEAP